MSVSGGIIAPMVREIYRVGIIGNGGDRTVHPHVGLEEYLNALILYSLRVSFRHLSYMTSTYHELQSCVKKKHILQEQKDAHM